MCVADAFERLPEGISSLKKLVDLQLYRCGVRALPAAIGAMHSLETLLVEGSGPPGLRSRIIRPATSRLGKSLNCIVAK